MREGDKHSENCFMLRSNEGITLCHEVTDIDYVVKGVRVGS